MFDILNTKDDNPSFVVLILNATVTENTKLLWNQPVVDTNLKTKIVLDSDLKNQ